MSKRFKSKASRSLAVIGVAAGIWLAGFLPMRLSFGEDRLLRLSYDTLHLFTNHQPDHRVLVIALNENSDRKLGRRQGEPFSRRFHAKLLARLKQAGVERVCYDIIFDLPSSDPAADEQLVNAVRSHGHVILGATEELAGRDKDKTLKKTEVIKPFPALRDAAEGCGLVNVGTLDRDGVVRRFDNDSGLLPTLAMAAAKAELREQPDADSGLPWMHYKALPGTIPTVDFADCLNPEIVPDDMLRGKTVFIGGQYAADDYGRRDTFKTPYSRFGAPAIYGVTWHAVAFLNARDGLWLTLAGPVRDGLWCLPFALAALLVFKFKGGGWKHLCIISGLWLLLAVVLAIASLLLIWKDQVLVNWAVPLLVQFPCCLVALSVRPNDKILAAAPARDLGEVSVFISFSTKDLSIASDLQRFLSQSGYPSWLCKEHIESGGAWADSIAAALSKCQVVLFIVSEHSIASDYCLDEITLAKSKKKRIIPLRIDNSPLPGRYELHLAATQEIDGRAMSPEELLPVVAAAVNRAMPEPQPAVQC
jgi:CHASE2 domain-containing sensor protein